MRSLQSEFQGADAPLFLVIHQREPHAEQMGFRDIRQPETFEARLELALRAREELELPFTILVDSMDDASRALFSDLPSPAFVLDRQGRIAAKMPWADPDALRRALKIEVEKTAVVDRSAITDRGGLWADGMWALSRGDRTRAIADFDALAADPVPVDCEENARLALVGAIARGGLPPASDLSDRVTRARDLLEKAYAEVNPGLLVSHLVSLAEALPAGSLRRETFAAAAKHCPSSAPAVEKEWLKKGVSKPEDRDHR